jgi:beta-glucosidase
VSPLAAIKARLGSGVAVTYAPDNQNRAAVRAAEKADIAIVIVGNHPTCGRKPGEILQSLIVSKGTPCNVPSEGMESSDRRSLTLEQEDLVRTVYNINRRTVVVLIASAPYAINWTQQNVPAILHTSHGGQEGGNAIADVLFGDYNPAGRLVQTWVKSIDELPPMMDYNIRHGWTYMYFKGAPLYPFGFGLSYTRFAYRNLRAGSGKLSVEISNTGSRDGDEVVQFYASYSGSKVERPARQLVGFGRVTIPRGETRTISVPFRTETVAYWDEALGRLKVEPSQIRISVGGSSADLRLQRIISVN